jgi:putative transposase
MYESLSHSKWECKYHAVFIPKFRRKSLYGELRRHLGDVFRKLALQKESRIEEGHLMPDHVHMMISILPKYAVSQVIGYTSRIKLRSIYISPCIRGEEAQFSWASLGHVGRDEAVIRKYIKRQEKRTDGRLDQMNLQR